MPEPGFDELNRPVGTPERITPSPGTTPTSSPPATVAVLVPSYFFGGIVIPAIERLLGVIVSFPPNSSVAGETSLIPRSIVDDVSNGLASLRSAAPTDPYPPPNAPEIQTGELIVVDPPSL